MAVIPNLMLAALLAAGGAPKEAPLLSLNSAEGVRRSMGPEDARVESVTGAGNTTDGDGAIRFSATAPAAAGNKYAGVMIPLKEPVDLRESRVLLDARTGSPEDTQAFYVRFYNRGESKAAWSFNSWDGRLKAEWRTFSCQAGLASEGLAWEADVVENRVADRVDRIEFIIGTHDDGKAIDLVVDNLRTAPRLQTIQDLEAPKALVRDTVLVRAGQPAATILHPGTEAGRSAAAKIAAAVRAQTGVALPARPATKADREPAEGAILLGNVENNPALLLLYSRLFTPVDHLCPGPGGSLLHTIHDPFGKGVNAVVVGGSDDTGLARAAEAFATLVARQPRGNDLVVPRTFQAAWSPEFLKSFAWVDDAPSPTRLESGLAAARKALAEGRHTSIAGELRGVANRYRLTQQSEEARLFVALWDLYGESAVADPRKYGGPWGFDSDFPSLGVVAGWDVIEEDPAITDEERLRVTKTMARWLAEAVVRKVGTAKERVAFNHQTFPGLGALMAGLYFTQGYDVLEGPQWLAVADGLFQPQARRFKVNEDCNGYQWLTNGHQMQYALARPDFAFFENGNSRKTVDFLIGSMDNLGYQVPYGDTGSWKCWTSEIDVLSMHAFATGDPAATWIAQLKRGLSNPRAVNAFYPSSDGKRPDDANGVRVFPLEPVYYTTFREGLRPPVERCFDKISFREALDPKAAYLLLDGLSNGGHKHLDGNSLPRLTQFERIWLADNDYIKTQVKYHNSALVFKDGAASDIPAYAELVGAGETPRYGFSRTRLNAYSGADWDRAVVWLKDQRAFLVLDRMTAREAGEYQFRLLWHGVGECVAGPDGMLLRQKGPSLRIQLAPGPRVSVADDADLGKNWNGYPYADPVVRSLTGLATVNLKAGESYLYATVLHGTTKGDEKPWKLSQLAGDGVLVDTGRGQIAVSLSGLAGVAQGSLETDAAVVVLDAKAVTLLGATKAALGGAELHRSAQAACAEAPLRTAPDLLKRLAIRPPTPNLAVGGTAPAHPVAWERQPTMDRLVLSGNPGVPGSVNFGVKLTAAPGPAKANVFAADSPNKAEALLDGSAVNNTATSVMWDPGKTVTLTLDLGAPCSLAQVRWQQWWAKTSSKETAYLLERATLLASSDGFKADTRELGVVTDAGPHPDFGTPIGYAVDAKGAAARYVRLVLQPKAGTGIYLSEVVVEGKPAGAEAPQAGYHITHVAPARWGEGASGLYAATAEGDLLALNADGSPRWSLHFPGALNDVAAADLDGDGRDEAILARADYFVTAVDDDSREMWSKEIAYYRERPAVNLVRTGDLDGDGKPEVVAGACNWRFYAFKADGTELWNYETVHRSWAGAVADIDGDGRDEVLAGTEYYTAFALKGDGTLMWGYRMGPICHDVAAGAFDGDKTRGVVLGGGDGFIHYVGSDGKSRLKLQTGEEVRCVAAGDLDGDGRDEVLAGSQNNSVYCFGADAKLRWRKDVGSEVSALAVVGRVLVAGTGAGGVYTFDEAGNLLAASELKSRVVELKRDGDTVIAVTADGRLRRLQPRP